MAVTKVNYHKAGFSDLRTFCKKMTGSAPNGKQACIDALDKHYGKTSTPAAKPASKPASKPAANESSATAKETKTPGAKSSAKASKGDSGLAARVTALEKRMNTLFGADDEDAGFAKAASNLR